MYEDVLFVLLHMESAKRVKYPSFIERYFTKYYRTNVHNESKNDLLVLVHSNRICVLTLSEHHPIIANNLTVERVEPLTSINQSMSGKSKRGADYVQPNKLLYRIVCSENQQFIICAGIKGRLVEMNEQIVENPSLIQTKPQGEGFLAVFIPSLRDGELNIQSLMSEDEYQRSKQNDSNTTIVSC